MGANNRAVDHPMLHIRVTCKVHKHAFPNALVTPAGKSLVDRVPAAIFSRQQLPRSAAAGYPQHTFHKPSTFCFVLADVGIRFTAQEIPYLGPLIILEIHSCHEASLPVLIKCQHTLGYLMSILFRTGQLPNGNKQGNRI